ncbi:Actin-interacting protein 1,WD repeat-containing protein 1-B,WD repeat-containing protein 1-A,WD repeat-containing protein 1 [Lepeophtheirus salmonis]|uniref:Actin-interacting protein 1,WD repeat-containing protein 1-B,WD repeat-containing protein 1-A,WD repeat-containing protein 1 n=1 Tax=Lepeophtheirus salmonis TaxID=72036 RepID=A0A7R8CJY1_LEPSM|nr:Actin-interacting protein 1,WD repeat-containing protein 1-B,WD repeat-containing protein 1-A,WD repeat-containing protein 1 [Lepeophtheirus salmonis]CAF2845595.1 Actin-interacting protein 1,WD repeat-containing protein 1-B,WD repeat-containing protein 1-A,WD repeat-containing protein 1 [Lepeophtheirus salmonis]
MCVCLSAFLSLYLIRIQIERKDRGCPLVLGPDPKGNNFLYTHGNSVFIRSLSKPEDCDVYTQHATSVLVAKYSPSGFYIASADKSGKVRLWDTDLAWSGDNQRIVVVGEGREKFGHVFLADTGTSNGDITGQSRPVNSTDFKPNRPFRIITGSEDNTSAVYEGPPFKFKGTKKDHSRYVQTVRFSPDGNLWASGGFDGRIFLYGSKDSELIGEFHSDGSSKNAHAGGVYAISWNPNNKQILSASGDKTCCIWDVDTRKPIQEFVLGTNVEDQQLGCLWSGKHLLSVSLSGNINFLDVDNPSKPKHVIEGHNKPITALLVLPSEGKMFTGGSDGRIAEWDINQGSCKRITGTGHESQVNNIYYDDVTKTICTLGIDDVRRTVKNGAYVVGSEVKLGGQPKFGCCADGIQFVISVNGTLTVMKENTKIREETLDYEPSSISFNEESLHLAIGEGDSGNRVFIYKVDSGSNYTTTLEKELTLSANKKEWGFHTARVNCIDWSPNGKLVASGGLDCSIIIWSMKDHGKHCIIQSAHLQSQITGIKWLDDKTVVSTGQDSNVKIWDISFTP